MTAKNPVPARLFAFLARNAHIGVILRRGPSDWVQMIHWNTRNDQFTPGQWFHGRIYERSADVSPNGQLFVYSTYKPGNWKTNLDYGDSWTAISRPPYFTAIALWPRANPWEGGGYFLDDDQLMLNHWIENRDPHPNHQLPSDFHIEEKDDMIYAVGSIFEYRLQRDGWKAEAIGGQVRIRPAVPGSSDWEQSVLNEWNTPIARFKTVRNIRLWCDGYVNHRILMDRGIYRHSPYRVISAYRYRITDAVSGKPYHLPGMTWADFDPRNRLVLARQGKIYTARVDSGGLSLTELADLNANQPEAIESPDWAKHW